jgi:hypothetical protein
MKRKTKKRIINMIQMTGMYSIIITLGLFFVYGMINALMLIFIR